MAANTTRLQGEIAEKVEKSSMEIERLIVGFLRSLLDEQKVSYKSSRSASLKSSTESTLESDDKSPSGAQLKAEAK